MHNDDPEDYPTATARAVFEAAIADPWGVPLADYEVTKQRESKRIREAVEADRLQKAAKEAAARLRERVRAEKHQLIRRVHELDEMVRLKPQAEEGSTSYTNAVVGGCGLPERPLPTDEL